MGEGGVVVMRWGAYHVGRGGNYRAVSYILLPCLDITRSPTLFHMSSPMLTCEY